MPKKRFKQLNLELTELKSVLNESDTKTQQGWSATVDVLSPHSAYPHF